MTIPLTCACGARLEIDETFAGKTVNCPDCQKPLNIPKPEKPGLQTSGFALASIVLAVAGAFTLVGTLLAVLFGALALRDLARRPEEVTGRRYAVAGIALGVVFTALTTIALTPAGLFGLNHLMARAQWAGKLDYSGPEEIVRTLERYAITRPSPKWGVRRSEREGEEKVEDQHILDDLVLVNLDEDAYLVCRAEPSLGPEMDVDKCREDTVKKFADTDWAALFGGKTSTGRKGHIEEGVPKRLKDIGTAEITEVRVDKTMAGQTRRFLIRVIKDGGTAFVLMGGSSRSNFDRVEPEIRKAMDSFRTLLDADR
jgi:hypothetical protein